MAGIAVNALGYDDPGVNQAMQEAGATGMLHVSNLYHTGPNARLAALLCETSFADKVHFSLTGADANEGAFKFARRYAREKGNEEKYHILAFSNAFHGRLFGSLAATPRPKYQDPFKPLMPGVRFAEFNDLESARAQMDENVCAIIVEPVQGEGGIYPATQEFLEGLRALADEYDALLIFDEVQCGVGRTGHLWAYQGYGVEPDILTAAKPLAGGLPIGAILMRQKVADAMHPGDHASTFAGNPFTTHVAHHVVSRIADPGLPGRREGEGRAARGPAGRVEQPAYSGGARRGAHGRRADGHRSGADHDEGVRPRAAGAHRRAERAALRAAAGDQRGRDQAGGGDRWRDIAGVVGVCGVEGVAFRGSRFKGSRV